MGNVHTEVTLMHLTTEQLTAWKQDGTLIVPNVFSAEETAPATRKRSNGTPTMG